ncbi:MAG TPA: MobF family relaxase [Solirubrobacterales bacterium]|nr:MobF family relaxase [Solirubrobacterales bacterium]
MLSIGKLGRGQERYYLGKVAEGAEDYYSGQGEADGYWLGDAAEDLRLQGKVDPDQLIAMLSGEDPATGEPLGLRAIHGSGPVPGFDLTFSAPKSVSLTWALAGEGAGAEVAAAHAASVNAALTYMQQNACWTRRGRGGHEFLGGSGFLAAAYLHRSSRSGDPQLHTHVLIANATQGPDGRWTRLYHPAIYEHAKTAGYVYEAHLRDELTRRLGVRWAEVRNGIAEIEGFDPDHLRHFSKRRAEILEAVGPDASAEEMQIATLATRAAKDGGAEATETLRERWRSEAEEIGLSRELVRESFDAEARAAESIEAADLAAELTAHASHFDRREVIQAVASCLPAGAPGAEVVQMADSYLATADVIQLSESPRSTRYTTREIWDLEQKALDQARELAAARNRPATTAQGIEIILSHRGPMKPDQRAMVHRLLGEPEGLVVVIGEAGTGKSFALGVAARGWSGREIPKVAAPTWRAANVLRSEGMAQATTVASMLGELDRKERSGEPALRSYSTVVIDEAAMVDSRDLARVIDHVHRAEAKLVLIGDPEQLGEVGAGGLFAMVAGEVEPVRLSEVIRHEHDLDRDAAGLIRSGEGAEALELYRSAERVVVGEDAAAKREAMVGDWLKADREGANALMIARTNREVAELNARAREHLKAEGRLRSAEIEVGGQRFAEGDVVITRINDRAAEVHNRERWRVESVEVETGRLRLAGIDTGRQVGVDPGYLERTRERDGGPALEHAYAATIYQAQGTTVDRAFVAADAGMDKQQLYVAASRSREETHFYLTREVEMERAEFAPGSPIQGDGLEHIAKAAERDGRQAAAHEEALRSELAKLSSERLVARIHELRSEAGAERSASERSERLAREIDRAREELARIRAEREALPEPPRGFARKQEREALAREEAHLAGAERTWERHLEKLREEQSRTREPEHRVRAEVAVAEAILARREAAARTAARALTPDYITNELGRRPSDGSRQAAWDRAVREIERYRTRNAVRDRDDALGPEPKNRAAQAERRRAAEAIRRAQRLLRLEQTRKMERTIELGRGIGR